MDEDPLLRSRWNVQAASIVILLVAFIVISGMGLYYGKLEWKEWFNGMLPVLTMAFGWLLRGAQSTQ